MHKIKRRKGQRNTEEDICEKIKYLNWQRGLGSHDTPDKTTEGKRLAEVKENVS